MRKSKEGWADPFNPNFKANELNGKLQRQVKEVVGQSFNSANRSEYERVLKWAATINGKGDPITDITPASRQPVEKYLERPQNVEKMLDQAVDVRLERLLLDNGSLSSLGVDLRTRAIDFCRARGFDPVTLSAQTSIGDQVKAKSQLIKDVTAVVKSAVRKQVGVDTLLLADKPAVYVSKKALGRLGVSVQKDGQEYVLNESDGIALSMGKKRQEISARAMTSGIQLSPLDLASYYKLRNDVFKAYVSTLAFKKEFRGLFEYLLEAEEFKDDADMLSIMREIEANNKLLLSLPLDTTYTGRAFRKHSPGVYANNLKVHSVQGRDTEWGLPIVVNSLGDISVKGSDFLGSCAFCLGDLRVGIVGAYTGSNNRLGERESHQETSFALSNRFGGWFGEAQFGAVSWYGREGEDIKGSRSKLTLGVDTKYVSPFIEVLHRKGVSKWGAGSFAEVSPSVGVEVEVTQYTSEAYRLKAHVIGIVGFSYGFVQGAESLNRVSSKGGIDMRLQLETREGSCFSSKFTAGDLSGVGAAINIEITR